MISRSAPLGVAFVAILIVALGGCSTEPSPSESNPVGHPMTLAGTAWRVVSVAGRAPDPVARPTAVFGADQVTGSGGCNGFGGHYQYDPATGRIEMRELGMTLVGCDGPRSDFENAFFQALNQANLVMVDAQGLMALSGPGGVIVFQPDLQRAVEG